jgi:hypothetical protein
VTGLPEGSARPRTPRTTREAPGLWQL